MGWFDWMRRGGAGDQRSSSGGRTGTAACAAPRATRRTALRARLRRRSGRDDERYEIEREMLDGLEAVAELSATVSASGLSPIATGHRAVGGDRCYFSAPASLPDDPAQPSGTLLLTEARAIFVGGSRSLDVPVAQRRRAACARTAIWCWSAPTSRTCTGCAATASPTRCAPRSWRGRSPTGAYNSRHVTDRPRDAHRPRRHRTPARRRPRAARRQPRGAGLEPGVGRSLAAPLGRPPRRTIPRSTWSRCSGRSTASARISRTT